MTTKDADQIANEAARRVLSDNQIHPEPGELPLSALGWSMGEDLSCGEAIVQIVSAAVEIDRAQREQDKTELREKVRRYAEDRAAHARHPRLNTVGSGRIASDLFQILGLPYPEVPDATCGAPAIGGLCVLPRAHNMGKLDVPSNHRSSKGLGESE